MLPAGPMDEGAVGGNGRLAVRVPAGKRPSLQVGYDISLRDLASLVWEKKAIIAIAILAFSAASLALGVALPRHYQAEGIVVIDAQEIDIPDFKTVRSLGTVEPWGTRSAGRVLSSREVIEEAARALDLVNDPAFMSELQQTWLDNLLDWPRQFLAQLGLTSDALPSTPWAQLIRALQGQLRVETEERSYAVLVTFTWTDPAAAARFVNGLMETFIAHELESQRRLIVEASQRLRHQSDELLQELAATESQVRDLENSEDVVSTNAGPVITQRLLKLGEEQQDVDSESARVRQDIEQITAAASTGNTNLLNQNLVTPRLKALLEAQANASLRAGMARNAVDLGPMHPEFLAIQAQHKALQADIKSELDAIKRGLRNRLDALARRRSELNADATTLTQAAAASASKRALIDQLRGDVTSKQRLYDTYHERYRQTLANGDVLQSRMRIAARALAPTTPSGAGAKILAVVGALIGAFASVGWVIARRYAWTRPVTPAEFSGSTGLPVLGAIPWNRREIRRLASSESTVKTDDGTLITETVRGIIFGLRTSAAPRSQVVQVSSALPGEGKTSFALLMARVAARDGLNALCIDADLRRAALDDRAGIRFDFAVNDFIADIVDFDLMIERDVASPAHLIAARPENGQSLRLLEHERFRAMLAIARERYDLVVIDSPPVMLVVDPLILSSFVDQVVLIASAKSATSALIFDAVHRFEACAAPLAGVVMTQQRNEISGRHLYAGYRYG